MTHVQGQIEQEMAEKKNSQNWPFAIAKPIPLIILIIDENNVHQIIALASANAVIYHMCDANYNFMHRLTNACLYFVV